MYTSDTLILTFLNSWPSRKVSNTVDKIYHKFSLHYIVFKLEIVGLYLSKTYQTTPNLLWPKIR